MHYVRRNSVKKADKKPYRGRLIHGSTEHGGEWCRGEKKLEKYSRSGGRGSLKRGTIFDSRWGRLGPGVSERGGIHISGDFREKGNMKDGKGL